MAENPMLKPDTDRQYRQYQLRHNLRNYANGRARTHCRLRQNTQNRPNRHAAKAVAQNEIQVNLGKATTNNPYLQTEKKYAKSHDPPATPKENPVSRDAEDCFDVSDYLDRHPTVEMPIHTYTND